MASTVADVMTRNPVTANSTDPVRDVARQMRDADTGAIIVLDNGTVSGIVTDRDIVVRVLAEGKDADTPVSEACTSDATTVGPDTSIEQVIQLMRSGAIRRLPVVQNDRPVGIVSIGDLAIERDSDSALAEISAAEGNN